MRHGTAARPRGPTGTPRASLRQTHGGRSAKARVPPVDSADDPLRRRHTTVWIKLPGVSSSCRQGVNSGCRLTTCTGVAATPLRGRASARAIARELGVSRSTVKEYLVRAVAGQHASQEPVSLFDRSTVSPLEHVGRLHVPVVLQRQPVIDDRLLDVLLDPIARLGMLGLPAGQLGGDIATHLDEFAPVVNPAQLLQAVIGQLARQVDRGHCAGNARSTAARQRRRTPRGSPAFRPGWSPEG
jgi:hypothetical protein